MGGSLEKGCYHGDEILGLLEFEGLGWAEIFLTARFATSP